MHLAARLFLRFCVTMVQKQLILDLGNMFSNCNVINILIHSFFAFVLNFKMKKHMVIFAFDHLMLKAGFPGFYLVFWSTFSVLTILIGLYRTNQCNEIISICLVNNTGRENIWQKDSL